ncbi:hypothetical protein L6452_40193 [Arctium lappa]|uniref:Uncharacterized protein n=1 Tax=Arctium lappa TaxID=4217 RepID=A0ACB8XM19_ARCLA|nr:hypothetical protein L6452_40193 [Arctium lappa]
MASSTGSGGNRRSPLCDGWMRVVATKKRGWTNPLALNNSVKKLQRCSCLTHTMINMVMNSLRKKVDCDENKELCTKYGVHGYPSIKWFPKGSLEPKRLWVLVVNLEIKMYPAALCGYTTSYTLNKFD